MSCILELLKKNLDDDVVAFFLSSKNYYTLLDDITNKPDDIYNSVSIEGREIYKNPYLTDDNIIILKEGYAC